MISVLPDHEMENDRIVDPSDEGAKKITDYLDQVARRTLPDWDWEKKPITFLLSRSDEVVVLNRKATDENPVIVLGERIIDLIQNEDQMAFFLAYQAEHWLIKDHYGLSGVSQRHDALADIRAVQRMVDAGYNWQQSITLLRIMHSKGYGNRRMVRWAKAFGFVRDVEAPDIGGKIKNIHQKLSHMTHVGEQDVQKELPRFLPLPDNFQKDFKKLVHTSWMDKNLPKNIKELSVTEQKQILLDLVPPNWTGDEATYKARNNDFILALRCFREADANEVDDFVDWFFTQRHRLRGKVYEQISGNLKRADLWGPTPIMAPFKRLETELRAFLNRDLSREERAATARRVVGTYRSLSSEFEYKKNSGRNTTNRGYQISWKLAQLSQPHLADIIEDIAYFKKKNDNPTVAALIQAAWMVGAGDNEQLWDVCDPNFARQLMMRFGHGLDKRANPAQAFRRGGRNKWEFEKQAQRPLWTFYSNRKMRNVGDAWPTLMRESFYTFMEAFGPSLAFPVHPDANTRDFMRKESKHFYDFDPFPFDDFAKELGTVVRTANEQQDERALKNIRGGLDGWLKNFYIWRDPEQGWGNPDWFRKIQDAHKSIKFVFGLPPYDNGLSDILFTQKQRYDFLKQQGFFKNAGLKANDQLLPAYLGMLRPNSLDDVLGSDNKLLDRSRKAFIYRFITNSFGGKLSNSEDVRLLTQLVQPYYEEGRETEWFWGDSTLRGQYQPDPNDYHSRRFSLWVREKIDSSCTSEKWSKDLSNLPIRQQGHIVGAMEHFDIWPNAAWREHGVQTFLTNLKQEPSSATRREITEALLWRREVTKEKKKRLRALNLRHVGLCNGLSAIWAKSVAEDFGPDDKTVSYLDAIKPKISEAAEHAMPRYRPTLFEDLCQETRAQGKVCQLIVDELDLKSQDFYNTLIPVPGAAAFIRYAADSKKTKFAFLDYLSKPYCEEGRNHVLSTIDKYSEVLSEMEGKELIDKETAMDDYHRHFHALTLEQQALILDHLLVSSDSVLKRTDAEKANLETLQYVEKKLFPKTMQHVGKVRDYFRSHIGGLPTYMQSVILAAMLATRNHAGENDTLGQRFATLLEFMGPAYVKLGQGIHSCPHNLPDDFRGPLERLKARAQKRPYYEVIVQAEEALPNFIKANSTYGEVLGSASFKTALGITFKEASTEIGGVLLLQKENAQQAAVNGFQFMENALNGCTHGFWKENKDVVVDLVQEAKEMSLVETDTTYSPQQNAVAHQVYGGIQTQVKFPSGESFAIDYDATKMFGFGKTHELIQRMPGQLYNGAVFEDSPLARRAIALSYVSVELVNMLSGKPFDVDRHGAQMRIEDKGAGQYKVGLFDFGGMGLSNPTEEDKDMLVDAALWVGDAALKGDNPVNALNAFVQDKKGPGIQHVKLFRKGLLALGDFMKELKTEDYTSCLLAVCQSPEVDNNLKDMLMRKAVETFGATEQFKAVSLLTKMPFVSKNLPGLIKMGIEKFGLSDRIPTVSLSRKESLAPATLIYRPLKDQVAGYHRMKPVF